MPQERVEQVVQPAALYEREAALYIHISIRGLRDLVAQGIIQPVSHRGGVRPFVERWGTRLADDITPLDIAEDRKERVAGGTKPKTVNHDVAVLKHAFVWAAQPEQQLVKRNPLEGLRAPREQRWKPRRGLQSDMEKIIARRGPPA